MRAVNLIPAEQRGGAPVGAGRSQGGAYAVLALCAGLAVLALLYGLASHQVSSRRSQVAVVTAKAQQAQAQAAQLAPYTSFVALREQRRQAVEQLVDSRFDWAHVFHEFGRVLPIGVSISSLSGTVGASGSTSSSSSTSSTSSAAGPSLASAAPSVSSATPAGSVPSFTLTGCATSQPEVALMLERLRLMDGVAEVNLQSSTKSSAGGGAGSAGCPLASDPAFTATVSFDPLPSTTAAAAAASTRTVALGSGSTARPSASQPSGTGAQTK